MPAPDLAANPLLSVEHLTRRFGGLAALEDVSFAVPAGTTCGLIGPNGAGKTTLINIISGLVAPTSGQILLDGVSVAGQRPHRVARLGVARTFQNIRLFSDLTVLENVMVGRHLKRHATVVESLLGLPRARHDERDAREAASALIERLGMARLARTEAGALSYGDQRRVEIARALALEPRLLLLDEPAAGLNAAETASLAEFLQGLKASGLTLLVIEHDMDMIMRVSDSVVVLSFGRKIAEGPPAEIQQDPRVVEAYLGEDEETGVRSQESGVGTALTPMAYHGAPPLRGVPTAPAPLDAGNGEAKGPRVRGGEGRPTQSPGSAAVVEDSDLPPGFPPSLPRERGAGGLSQSPTSSGEGTPRGEGT